MKKTVVYYCTSVYQILILTIMIELYYGKYKNIVIMAEDLANRLCLDALHNYADEIITLSEAVSEYEITKQLDSLWENNDVALFGMFTWGGYGAYIYDKIPNDIQIVLLDEGVSTYEYKKFMRHVAKDIDFSRIREIWMIDPSISQNDKKVPEHRIPLEKILKDKERFTRYLDTVNEVFKYQHEKLNEDILFFDRYMVQVGRIPIKYERFVIENLYKLMGKNTLGVKTHPSEERGLAEWRYRNLPVVFYKGFDVPWELVVLNCMYHYNGDGELVDFPQVLIAANTTTLLFSQILLQQIGVEVPIIYINRIINYYLRDIENVAEKTIEGYKNIYENRQVFMPGSWKELYDVLAICIPGFEPNIDKLEEIYAAEHQLLCEEYRKTLTVEGNLLQRVYLEVFCMKLPEIMRYHSYIIAGEKEYTVLFENCVVKGLSEIEFRFFPAGIPTLYQNVVIENLSYCRNGRKIVECKNAEYKLTNKVPYVPFEIRSQGDEISRLTVTFTTSREYNLLSEVYNADRFQSYFNDLTEWIRLLQLGSSFSEYCKKKLYRTIGIYGNGKMGRLLKDQIDGNGINTVIIDQKEFEGCISVSKAVAQLNELDLIIVTPLADFYNIHKKFGFEEKVIGIDDFLKAVGADYMGTN